MFGKFAFSINFEWVGEKLANIVHSQNRSSLGEGSGGGTFLKLSEILILIHISKNGTSLKNVIGVASGSEWSTSREFLAYFLIHTNSP